MAYAKKVADKETIQSEVVEVVNETPAKEEVVETPLPKRKALSPETLVSVKSNVNGPLTYNSKRQMGFSIRWDEAGEEQFVELQELMSMRATQRRFFTDNFIYIEDSEVLKYLGMDRYYKHQITSDNFDELFKMQPDEIKAKIGQMSNGMKKNVASYAKEMINAGKFDSMRRIRAFEESIGVSLV